MTGQALHGATVFRVATGGESQNSENMPVGRPDVPNQTGTQEPEHKGGLPQLNVHDFAPQLVWLALTFGALYWIMSRIALPRIADVIEKRHSRIADDIDAARQLAQKSEVAEAAYKADLATARAKAHAIAQETRDTLNARTDRKRAEVDKKINAKLEEAEQKITKAKNAALGEVNDIAGSTTKEIVRHLIGKEIAGKDLSKALEAASTK